MVTMTDIPRPRFARLYVQAAKRAVRRGATEHRRRLLEGLSGRIVEVGAGNGLNFAHYPSTVTEVVAVEPEPTLREAAREAAGRAPARISVRAGQADALDLADGETDADVVSLVLCSVPDQASALAERHRVLRPSGQLRFYEHVIANGQPKRTMLQVADRSGLWPKVAGGCHLARDTTAAISSAGFDIEQLDRFGFAASRFEPRIPHILGVARRRE